MLLSPILGIVRITLDAWRPTANGRTHDIRGCGGCTPRLVVADVILEAQRMPHLMLEDGPPVPLTIFIDSTVIDAHAGVSVVVISA
jgi:hypothetical protein